jgi:hypothetical protein
MDEQSNKIIEKIENQCRISISLHNENPPSPKVIQEESTKARPIEDATVSTDTEGVIVDGSV